MAKLKVSLKSDIAGAGNCKYRNEINSENFRELALVLKDLKNLNLPIDKAVLEMKRSNGNSWNDIIGL